MSETWNAEKQAYADCERCHGRGTYPGAESGAGCGYCLKHRIAELEAALRKISAQSTLLAGSSSLWSAGDRAHADAMNFCAAIANKALEGVEDTKR